MKLQLLVFVVLASLQGAESCTKADCHGLKCPDYNVLNSTQEYEKRYYGDTEWLTTSIESRDLFQLMSARSRLKAVADGCSPKVDSWPVLLNVDEELNTFSLSWFIPPNTACPNSDSAVTQQKRPAGNVYVRCYEGAPDTTLAQEEKSKLLLALQKDTLVGDVEEEKSTWAGYDLYPHQPYHNEIWIK